MFKALRKQEGFTLIELMIVVAIIGILAAIAIPNFLTYQMKSRQSEAKTNLQAIKTSEVSFQAERGCYVGVSVEGVMHLQLVLNQFHIPGWLVLAHLVPLPIGVLLVVRLGRHFLTILGLRQLAM